MVFWVYFKKYPQQLKGRVGLWRGQNVLVTRIKNVNWKTEGYSEVAWTMFNFAILTRLINIINHIIYYFFAKTVLLTKNNNVKRWNNNNVNKETDEDFAWEDEKNV